MSKYFGTDGIRGEANVRLTVDIALALGKYLAFANKGEKLLIGMDTRLSSSMFANAVAAGASSMGSDVYVLGVCATPAVAHLIKNEGFAGGVMISASHNPYMDNGLKVFANTGMKITDELQSEIEQFIDGDIKLDYVSSDHVGQIINYDKGLDLYLNYIESKVTTPLDGLHIVLDCANGSAISSAEEAFKALGAKVDVIHWSPDGFNINTECGSTHPETLQKAVLDLKADMGFAFDGDADRCLAVNHLGEMVDGDQILYILGCSLKEKNKLNHNTVVSTIMANLGFMKACEAKGLSVVATDVGDKHVFAKMVEMDYLLGGEQSGHIILKDSMTTGDGVLTALFLSEIVAEKKMSFKELTRDFEEYPQKLVNIKVKDKKIVMEHADVLSAVSRIEHELKDVGRVLVRASGTEELVRVMIEAKSIDLCDLYADDMMSVIQNIG